MNATIDLIAEWLKDAKAAISFTGAGISTESGIPDFRSGRRSDRRVGRRATANPSPGGLGGPDRITDRRGARNQGDPVRLIFTRCQRYTIKPM